MTLAELVIGWASEVLAIYAKELLVVSTKKAMKLISRYTGQMECKTCGSVHFASIKPGGGFYRGSWQCSNGDCPTCPAREVAVAQ